MQCTRCNGPVELQNNPKATEEGEDFLEQYRCTECGGYGSISGVVGEPVDNWRFGGVLE